MISFFLAASLAIAAHPPFAGQASKDDDFKTLRNLSEFKNLVSQN